MKVAIVKKDNPPNSIKTAKIILPNKESCEQSIVLNPVTQVALVEVNNAFIKERPLPSKVLNGKTKQIVPNNITSANVSKIYNCVGMRSLIFFIALI